MTLVERWISQENDAKAIPGDSEPSKLLVPLAAKPQEDVIVHLFKYNDTNMTMICNEKCLVDVAGSPDEEAESVNLTVLN